MKKYMYLLGKDDTISGTGNIETRAGEMYKWAIRNNDIIYDDPNGLLLIVAPHTMNMLEVTKKIKEHLQEQLDDV